MKLLRSARQQFIRYMIFWCLNPRKIFIHTNKQQDWQLILKFQHVKLNQARKSEISAIPDQMINWLKKDQQNASCQITTCEPKMVLHLVKSKIYSKHHQQQFRGTSDSLSQIHQSDLAQNLLCSSHSLNQAPLWTSTAYSQAHLTMIWIANSALKSHWSSNSKWSSFNLVAQLVKKMLYLTCSIINKMLRDK